MSIDAENGEGRRVPGSKGHCFKPDPLHLACRSSFLFSPCRMKLRYYVDEAVHGRTGRRREKFPRSALNPQCIHENYQTPE